MSRTSLEQLKVRGRYKEGRRPYLRGVMFMYCRGYSCLCSNSALCVYLVGVGAIRAT